MVLLKWALNSPMCDFNFKYRYSLITFKMGLLYEELKKKKISFVETNACSSEDVCAVVILGKLQGLCEMGGRGLISEA